MVEAEVEVVFEAWAEIVMQQTMPVGRQIVLKNGAYWRLNVISVVPACFVRFLALAGGENESGRDWKTW